MNQSDKETIAGHMNRLPFVRWDRFVESEGDVLAYGWIDRPDGRSDFILLKEELTPEGWAVGYTTSSATHSVEIGRLLYDDPAFGDTHVPCQRIDLEFGPLVENRIVIR